MSEPSTAAPHLEPLDRLRSALALLVIALHAAIPYAVHLQSWYVKDVRRSLFVDVPALIGEALAMPGFFFLAGYLAPASLARRGPAGYVRRRLARLGIPFLLALLLVGPYPSYLEELARGGAPGYLAHAARFFAREHLSHGHLWFLPFLLSLNLISAGLARPLSKWLSRERVRPARGPSLGLALGFALSAGLSMFVPQLFLHEEAWLDTALMNVQPSRAGLNVACYCLGLVAWGRRWLEVPGRRLPPLFAITGLLAAGYLGTLAAAQQPGVYALKLAAALLHCALTAAGLAAALELVRRRRGSRGALSKLAPRTYGMYLVHYLPVLGLAFLLRQAELPLALKWLAVFALSTGASVLGADVLRRIPGLRRVI